MNGWRDASRPVSADAGILAWAIAADGRSPVRLTSDPAAPTGNRAS